MLVCQFCNKEYSKNSSLLNHSHRCPLNPNRVIQNGRKGKDPWNKGLTKDDHLNIARPQFVGKRWGRALTGHPLEFKQKMRELAIKNELGGHTSKKTIWFKKKTGETVYLQSSYEVKFANILEELDIDWERPSYLMWTDSNGIDHRYYPDFKIGEKYFDTKNDYLAIKDADKIERVSKQNNVIVEVITYDKITKAYIKNALLV